ncbi:hypothetical protein SAMN04515671_1693 [Nakamurella panacisegetis]|uniref:Uncharacterized protein n=1 Tax=Nakamurella panacisegetis TaxID=1090615 RepID=A0A1H0LJR6_9ACTN|nr:hypothetical protein [Nakamurella panacisegetis]SDO68437.1 hypothetical protein SAMN04515671_1693 [Nakamurella panacisegetis]
MRTVFSKKTVTALLAAAGLSMTGCSSTSTAGPAPSTTTAVSPTTGATGTTALPTTSGAASGTSKASAGSTSGKSSAPGLPKGVTAAASIPTSALNKANLRANVALTGCKSVTGGWGATGTATNPGKKAIAYTITVFFTTTAATVIDTSQTHFTVKPGEKKTWTATKQFTTPPKMLCVLRGVG